MNRKNLIIFLLSLLPLWAQGQYVVTQNTFTNNVPRAVEFVPVPNRAGKMVMEYQDGMLRLYDLRTPSVAPVPMLSVRSRTLFANDERGLLGLAFHPKFPKVNKLYVNYTTRAQQPLKTVIASFRVDTTTLLADSSTFTELLSFSQPFTNHNGGKVAFGPDGKLYIGTGDGGSAFDPQGNGQNKRVLLGKILRIDVDSTDPGLAYKIPRDNPFYDSAAGIRKEIYAYGMRNPWRFSFDPPTRRLWAGDVGQNVYEEIDTIVSGGNYGWRLREGYNCLGAPASCATPTIKPLFVYAHTTGTTVNVNSSITGGFVYRGSAIPYLQGKYIYGDYTSGRIWSLEFAGDTLMRNTLLLDSPVYISSFGEDADHELYVLNYVGGNALKLLADPTAIKAAKPVQLGVRVHPNPASLTLWVDVDAKEGTQVTVQLLSLDGIVLQTTLLQPKTTTLSHSFNLSGLPAGMYLVKVETAKEAVVKRVVVQ